MTVPNFDISESLFRALEDLEYEIMELAGTLRGDLIDWLAAAAKGELSLGELKELLEGEKALLEMTALQKKVETKVLLNTLKRDLLDALIGVVKGAL